MPDEPYPVPAAAVGGATSAKQDTQITAEQAIQATVGAITGAAVVTDANGTLQQYLRGIVKLLITAGTVVLGAGTAAIGKLAANSGVDIGDTDVKNLKGEAGAVVETGTDVLTGLNLESIQCLEDTVIASYTSSTLTGDSIAGFTLPAGTIIYARFSAITLTSGKIIGYIRNL